MQVSADVERFVTARKSYSGIDPMKNVGRKEEGRCGHCCKYARIKQARSARGLRRVIVIALPSGLSRRAPQPATFRLPRPYSGLCTLLSVNDLDNESKLFTAFLEGKGFLQLGSIFDTYRHQEFVQKLTINIC